MDDNQETYLAYSLVLLFPRVLSPTPSGFVKEEGRDVLVEKCHLCRSRYWSAILYSSYVEEKAL